MSNTAEHLEHAEHSQHAAHHPFDRLVAITMAIVAAVLASVTLLSHRAHTETLRLQTDANILQTKASDEWNFYQAKNIRSHEYTVFLTLLDTVAKEPGKEAAAKKAREDWSGKVDQYEKVELPKMKKTAEGLEEQATKCQEGSHSYHHRGDWFDLGELCVEVSLVLCSLALLTKRRSFWISGILAGLVGVAIALWAFSIPVPVPEGPPSEAQEVATH